MKTRRAILDAARQLFEIDGSHAVGGEVAAEKERNALVCSLCIGGQSRRCLASQRLLAVGRVVLDEFGNQLRSAIEQLARPDAEPHDTPHGRRHRNVEQLYAVCCQVID
jgi:hypothetical protein